MRFLLLQRASTQFTAAHLSELLTEPDKKKRKNRKKKTKKKEQKGKQKASSSDGDESSSKGASKSKKKKLSKMSRLHQELQALKEEVAVRDANTGIDPC